MGQFKHPSVVTMYGVVTKDETASTLILLFINTNFKMT